MNTVARLINTIYDHANGNSGNVPKCLGVSHKEYHDVMVAYLKGSGHAWVDKTDTLKLMGVPLVIVPFEDDPLYKRLQAMAVLCGAEITFPDAQFNDPMEPRIAEFIDNGVGYRFYWGKCTLSGQSMLVPIFNCFLSELLGPATSSIPYGRRV